MNIENLVRLLGTYYHDQGETIAKMHGKKARQLVVEFSSEVEKIVKQEEPHLELWEDFKHAPDDYQSEVMELLDSLEELNTGFRERMEDFLEAYTFGTENRLPVVRSDMVDEEDSDLYVRNLDTGQYDGTQIPNTGDESNRFDEIDLPDEDELE